MELEHTWDNLLKILGPKGIWGYFFCRPVSQAEMDSAYLAWAKSVGITLSGSLLLQHTPALGYHVVAQRALPASSLLISTPLPACYRTLSSCALVQALAAAGASPFVTSCAALCLRLATSDPHTALLRSLPEVHNVARWPGNLELPVSQRYTDILPVLKRHAGLFPGGTLPTRQAFVLAASLLLSRGFSTLPVAGGIPGSPVLAPVLDLLNHSPTPNSAVQLAASGASALECRAVRPIAAGEQVCISYGDLSDGDLLYTYGFTLCRALTAEEAALSAPSSGRGAGPGKKRQRQGRAGQAQAEGEEEFQLHGLTLGNPANTVALSWGAVLKATAALAALWAPSAHAAAGKGQPSPFSQVLGALAPLLQEGEEEEEEGQEGAVTAQLHLQAAGLPSALVHAVTALLQSGEHSKAQRRAAVQLALQGHAAGSTVSSSCCCSATVREALAAILSQRLRSFGTPLREDYAWWAAQCTSNSSSSSSSSSSEKGAAGKRKAGAALQPEAVDPLLALQRQVEMGQKEILVSLLAGLQEEQ